MKEACGKSLRVTRSYLLSNIQIQVGTRGTKANAGSHSHHSRAIMPIVVEATEERREPVTEAPVTWKERREYKGKRRGSKTSSNQRTTTVFRFLYFVLEYSRDFNRCSNFELSVCRSFNLFFYVFTSAFSL